MADEAHGALEAMSHTEVFGQIGLWSTVAEFLTLGVFDNWWMDEHYDPTPGINIWKAIGLARLCPCVWARGAMGHKSECCTAAWQLAFVSRHMRESVNSHCWGREWNADQRKTELSLIKTGRCVPPRVKEEKAAYFAWEHNERTKPMPLATYDGPGTCGGLWQTRGQPIRFMVGTEKGADIYPPPVPQAVPQPGRTKRL